MTQNSDLRPAGTAALELERYYDAEPVFIVGSVRSGTSAMMHALRHGAGIPGFNEGSVAQLLPALLAAVERHYSSHMQKPTTMLGSVPQEFMQTGIKNLFGTAYKQVMGAGRWLDKTPGGASIVKAAPLLLEMFPHARFVFCKRRGIENVLSRQRKYPAIAFANHCEGWAKTMEAWIAARPQLGECAVEIDQRDMALAPGEVADTVAGVLGLSPAQRDGCMAALRDRRAEQTRAIQDDAPVALADTGWSAADQETFVRVCGPMMQAFGYDLTAPGTGPRAYRFFVPVSDSVVERENIDDKRGFRALDTNRFVIAANQHGAPPAAVRYKGIDVGRFRRFSAELRIIGPGAADSDGLVFAFSVQRPGDGAVAFAAEQVVKGVAPAAWSFRLPELQGEFDAVLSVRPAGTATDSAPVSGAWIDARLVT